MGYQHSQVAMDQPSCGPTVHASLRDTRSDTGVDNQPSIHSLVNSLELHSIEESHRKGDSAELLVS